MRRWAVLLAVGAIGLALLAWQLKRSLGEEAAPVVRDAAAAGSASSAMQTNAKARTPTRARAAGTVTLRGAVRDDTGAAVANAQVCAPIEPCDDDACTFEHCARSREGGAYELAGVPLSARFVAATAREYRPATQPLRELVDGEVRTVDLELVRGGARVFGHVRDLSGAPIAGARLSEKAPVTTDADGAYEMWVVPGSLQIGARARGYATASRRVVAPAMADFALAPESTIAGRVVDANEQPVGGVSITSESERDDLRPERATSAADGSFTITGLAAMSYSLRAQAFGLAGKASVVVGLGQHVTGITIRVERAYQVGVHLQRADGSACTDGTVSLYDGIEHATIGLVHSRSDGVLLDAVPAGRYEVHVSCPPSTSREVLDVRDDLDVTYTVNDKPLGTLRVTIEAPGRPPGESDAMYLAYNSDPTVAGWKSVVVPPDRIAIAKLPAGTYRLRVATTSLEGTEEVATVRANETTDHTMRLPLPTMGRLRVRAVDSLSRPLSNVEVHIVGRDVDRTMRTLNDGTATLFFPGGEYDISSGRTTTRVHLANGGTREVRLVIPPIGVLRGKVVDDAGQPVTDAFVSRLMPSAFPADERMSSARVDASGEFELPVTSAGPYHLIANRIGGGESPIVEADLQTPSTLVVGGGGTLVGTLLDANGKRVPQFELSLFEDTRNLALGHRTFTDGTFRWANLAPGAYQLYAIVGNLNTSAAVTVAPNAKSATVELKLPRAYRVSGRVVDAVSREPIPGAKLTIEMDYVALRQVGITRSFFRRAEPLATDVAGRFTIDDMIQATYQLSIVAGPPHLDANQSFSVDAADVDLADIALARAR